MKRWLGAWKKHESVNATGNPVQAGEAYEKLIPHSPVAQWWSERLLTARLQVRAPPGEPFDSRHSVALAHGKPFDRSSWREANALSEQGESKGFR